MAKSLKSLLSKINLVDVVVVLVLIAVLMCLMKKMDVVEGLCVVNEVSLDNNCAPGVHPEGCAFDGDHDAWQNKCLSTPDANCENISGATGLIDTGRVWSGCMLYNEDLGGDSMRNPPVIDLDENIRQNINPLPTTPTLAQPLRGAPNPLPPTYPTGQPQFSDEKVPQFDERLPSQIVPESRRGSRPGTPIQTPVTVNDPCESIPPGTDRLVCRRNQRLNAEQIPGTPHRYCTRENINYVSTRPTMTIRDSSGMRVVERLQDSRICVPKDMNDPLSSWCANVTVEEECTAERCEIVNCL